MDDNLLQMAVDPASIRADKVVDLLRIKTLPEFSDEYSQAVLKTMIAGLLQSYVPKPQRHREGNVVEFPVQ